MFYGQNLKIKWSSTGKDCGVSMKYPPTPLGAPLLVYSQASFYQM